MAGKITYPNLKKEFMNFGNPVAEISVKNKKFLDNKEGFIAGGVSVELSSGMEASVAEFDVFNVYDMEEGLFLDQKLADYVELGAEVKIRMGYLASLYDVFWGFVAGMNYICEEGETPRVHVTAMDVKGIMMANRCSMQMKSRSYGEAVREILEKPVYSKVVDRLRISGTPDRREGGGESAYTVEMTEESDYEFVVKAAKKFNFEFFSDCGSVIFRKAKSQKEIMAALGINSGVLTFDVGYSLTGLADKVEVRAMDSGSGKLMKAGGKRSGDLSPKGKAKSLINKSCIVSVDYAVDSVKQAEARAEAILDSMSCRFGDFSCQCIGIPQLKPGKFFTLDKAGELAGNDFYITKVRHSLDDEGFRTRLWGAAGGLKSAGGSIL